ncbi:alpha/beta-Hydrolases superfamily protein [Zea mays]|uniref:Alpha/beta-Hydrolases superfamily protein n=1 Tax=Zea mays TaxID=4577 RepID=A0A1D6I4Z6_MAIZE|nr:alpha/beta-Hydrolases superfamily protein [Zea mays]
MEKARCARNLNIGNFWVLLKCTKTFWCYFAEVRNFGYYRTCMSSCLQVIFLFLVIRFW